MSQPVWNRPPEYQRDLNKNKDKDQASEFGFEEEDVDNIGADSLDQDAGFDAEFEQLRNQVETEAKLKEQAIAEVKQKEQRIQELQQISKNSQKVLEDKHKEQIKALTEEFERGKLELRVVLMEAGVDKNKLDEKMKDFSRSIDLARQVKELQEVKKTHETVMMDLLKEVNDYKTKISNLEGELKQAQNEVRTLGSALAAAPKAAPAAAAPAAAAPAAAAPAAAKPLSSPAAAPAAGAAGSRPVTPSVPAAAKGAADAKARPGSAASVRPASGGAARPAGGAADEWKKKYEEQAIKMRNLQAQLRKLQTTGVAPALAPVPAPAAQRPASRAEDEKANARVEELEKKITELKGQLNKTQEQIQQLQESEKKLIAEKTQLIESKKEGAESKEIERLNKEIEEYKKKEKTLQTTLGTLQKKIQGVTAQSEEKKGVLEKIKAGNAALREELAALKKAVNQSTKDALTKTVPTLGKQIEDFVKKKMSAQAKVQERLDEALKNYKKELKLRRQYFNQLQELKGNIRVYARVRPPKEDALAISFPDSDQLTITQKDKKQQFTYEFEKIFKMDSTQEQVFEEIKDLVLSVLDGYNVCIFAYGQTGSGKTYTMEGPKSDPGINTRTLRKLFAEVTAAQDIEYKIELTLLEIYNNQIRDLLDKKHDKNLRVVHGQYGMEVPDLTKVEVKSEEEVFGWLKQGATNRATARTDVNEHSSRSHLVLTVYALGKNVTTGQTLMGKLHLIDLAGSERVAKSGVVGDRLKEAQAINASLSALGNCIAARANKKEHVPYRDSALTYLLQDSIEKNSKTLMFVQISPEESFSAESICSLNFASRARQVELGKVEKNKGAGAR